MQHASSYYHKKGITAVPKIIPLKCHISTNHRNIKDPKKL